MVRLVATAMMKGTFGKDRRPLVEKWENHIALWRETNLFLVNRAGISVLQKVNAVTIRPSILENGFKLSDFFCIVGDIDRFVDGSRYCERETHDVGPLTRSDGCVMLKKTSLEPWGGTAKAFIYFNLFYYTIYRALRVGI